MSDLTLSEEEIKEITGYVKSGYQLKVLAELGIPARKRVDNSISVLRMHCLYPSTNQTPINAPKLKSSRK